MAYGKDRTSNVSPWGDRTSNVRWVSWRTGTGREGRKEGTSGPLGKENAPLGEPYGARRKRDFLVIQGRRLVPREASKGNKGSTRLGSLGREVGASSDHADQKENGRAPVGTSPVGLHDAPFGATCGRGGIKRGMPNESKDGVFVRGVHALVFESLIGRDSVGVAGCGGDLCGFHDVFMGVNCPRIPRLSPKGWPGNSHGRFDEVPFPGPVNRDVD